MITIADIDAAPEAALRAWWPANLHPWSLEGNDVDERLAIRCEALGLVDEKGRLR